MARDTSTATGPSRERLASSGCLRQRQRRVEGRFRPAPCPLASPPFDLQLSSSTSCASGGSASRVQRALDPRGSRRRASSRRRQISGRTTPCTGRVDTCGRRLPRECHPSSSSAASPAGGEGRVAHEVRSGQTALPIVIPDNAYAHRALRGRRFATRRSTTRNPPPRAPLRKGRRWPLRAPGSRRRRWCWRCTATRRGRSARWRTTPRDGGGPRPRSTRSASAFGDGRLAARPDNTTGWATVSPALVRNASATNVASFPTSSPRRCVFRCRQSSTNARSES